MLSARGVLFVCFFSVCVSLIVTEDSYNCTTPSDQQGYCISIRLCPRLDAIALNRNRTDSEVELLLKSKCGIVYNKRIPRVCCSADQLLPTDDMCGVGASSDRIIGGVEANLGEFPWIALLFYKQNNYLAAGCAASLISKRYAITASHCVRGSALNDLGTPYMLRFGEHNRSNEEKDCVQVVRAKLCADKVVDILIENVISHVEYKPVDEPKNDIALLRLQDEVPFTEYIKPICLPNYDATRDLGGRTLFLKAIGWGLTEHKRFSDVLLYVSVPYVNEDVCESSLKNYPEHRFVESIGNKQICAGGRKALDTCKGDSGGPLMHKISNAYNLIGIVSYGPIECGTVGVPAVYTKVYPYLDWIMSSIKP